MKGLPDSIASFYGDHPSAAQLQQANIIAYTAIVLILALLVWTVIDMHKTHNKILKDLD